MSPATRRFRFHAVVAELPEAVLRYLTEVDHVHHVALLAETLDAGAPRQVGEARWVRRVDERTCADFAIAIADDHQHSGLGQRLLDLLEQSAGERGIERLCGHVLRDNRPMLGWLESRGWALGRDEFDPGVVGVELWLGSAAKARRSERRTWGELREAA
jgi:acetyltransferase